MDPRVRRRVFDLLFAGAGAVEVAAVVGVSDKLVRKWRSQVGRATHRVIAPLNWGR